MIDPNVVGEQAAGGVLPGIGGVLYEPVKYDNEVIVFLFRHLVAEPERMR
jgi:hypothetical protein